MTLIYKQWFETVKCQFHYATMVLDLVLSRDGFKYSSIEAKATPIEGH